MGQNPNTSLIQGCNCWSIFLLYTKQFGTALGIVPLPGFQKQNISFSSLNTCFPVACKKLRFKATKPANDLTTKTNHNGEVTKVLKQKSVKAPLPTETALYPEPVWLQRLRQLRLQPVLPHTGWMAPKTCCSWAICPTAYCVAVAEATMWVVTVNLQKDMSWLISLQFWINTLGKTRGNV